MTVKESKLVHGLFLSESEGGGHIKNLFLRDHKKRFLLLVAHQDAFVNLKNLQININVGRLSFGSKESLFNKLGVFERCSLGVGRDVTRVRHDAMGVAVASWRAGSSLPHRTQVPWPAVDHASAS